MSDDVPTQRLPQQGDTPTEQIQTGEVAQELGQERQKSRGLLAALIVAGALLLVALIVLAVFLVNANSAPQAGTTQTPAPSVSSSAEPSETPTPTPSATQEPEPTGAEFTTFTPGTEVKCEHGGPVFTPDPPVIQVTWATVRTASAWIVQGTSDAADSRFMELPLSGNQGDFQYPLQFPCFQDDTKFTITVVGSDGVHVSKTWTVTNIGEVD